MGTQLGCTGEDAGWMRQVAKGLLQARASAVRAPRPSTGRLGMVSFPTGFGVKEAPRPHVSNSIPHSRSASALFGESDTTDSPAAGIHVHVYLPCWPSTCGHLVPSRCQPLHLAVLLPGAGVPVPSSVRRQARGWNTKRVSPGSSFPRGGRMYLRAKCRPSACGPSESSPYPLEI